MVGFAQPRPPGRLVGRVATVKPVGGAISRPTMKDVAALAEVSLKTVSRVINNERAVNAEMAERVHRAVTQLGYQPDLGASALRRRDRRSATVAVLLEDLSNPFSATIYRSIEEVASEHHVSVLGGSLEENPEREHELVNVMMRHRVDGVVIAPASHDHRYLRQDQRAGVPFVFVDRPPVVLEADSVLTDSYAASAGVVRHLARQGHRYIAHLGGDQAIWTSVQRYQGFVSASAQAGLVVHEALLTLDIVGIEEAYNATRLLLASRPAPTAIFTGQNLLTIGAVRAIREAALQYQVALVGFDDFLLADLLEPPVTVVAQDVVGMGRAAAKLLFSRIAGDTSPARAELVPSTLIMRGSGEIAPR